MSKDSNPDAGLKDYLSAAVLLILVVLISIKGTQILRTVTGSELPLAVVEGRSMRPLLRDGDLVVVVKEDPSEIKVGDIIVYKTMDGRYIIHRVIGVEIFDGKYYYRTKGDNWVTNPIEDCRFYDRVQGAAEDFGCGVGRIGVGYDRVVGVVMEIDGSSLKIPYLGYISLLLHG